MTSRGRNMEITSPNLLKTERALSKVSRNEDSTHNHLLTWDFSNRIIDDTKMKEKIRIHS